MVPGRHRFRIEVTATDNACPRAACVSYTPQ